MKRILAIFTLFCLLLGLLAACSKETPAGTEAGSNNEDKLTVTLYHNLNAKTAAVLQNKMTGFQENNPDLQVVLQNWDGQLSAEKNGGLLLCDRDAVAQYQSTGALMALDGLVTEELLADYQMFYALDRKNLFSLPVMYSSLVLYYNQSFFDVNGIPVPFSWEEVEQTCENIKQMEPESTPLLCDAGADLFLSLCSQQEVEITNETGTKYLFDTEKTQAFAKRMNRWCQKGWLSAQTESSAVLQQWKSGNNYMLIGSSSDAVRYRPEKEGDAYLFELGVGHMPQSLDAAAGIAVRSWELCVLNTDDAQLQAASELLAQYMSTAAFQAEFSRAAGYIPALMSAEADPGYDAFLSEANGGENVTALAAMTCLEQQYAYTLVPVTANTRQQLDTLVQTCFELTGDNVDPQIAEAFREAVRNCEK